MPGTPLSTYKHYFISLSKWPWVVEYCYHHPIIQMRKLRVKITQSKSGRTDLSPGSPTPWKKNTLDGSLASTHMHAGHPAPSWHHSGQSLVSTLMTSCMFHARAFCPLLHPHRKTGMKRGRTGLCNQRLRNNGKETRQWPHFCLVLPHPAESHHQTSSWWFPSQQDSAFTCLPCKTASREKAAQFPHYLIALWKLLPSLSRLISQMRRMN